MINNFVFLGSSSYALQILSEIIKISRSRPLCIIDKNMHTTKANQISNDLPELKNTKFYDSNNLENDDFLVNLAQQKPLLALSVNFTVILKPKFLNIFPNGVVNLHPSFLPYNRGHWPEVWAIVNNTPAGVSLHYIEREIDTGNIIKQTAITVLPEDNGQSICTKTEIAGLQLIKSVWNKILYKKITGIQQTKKYSLNKHSDLEKLMIIDLNKTYSGLELINILRSLTMPDFIPGAYFIDPQSGDQIFINVYLTRKKN